MMPQPFLDLKPLQAHRGDPPGTVIALNLFVLVCYTLTGLAGLRLAFIGHAVTLFWPPSGIAFAALWLCGFRLVPAIALGAFLINLVALGSPQLAALVALGNILPATMATIMLRASISRREQAGSAGPGELWRVWWFILIAVLGSTMLSATVGSLAIGASGQAGNNLAATWPIWWMGDAMGVMIAAPPILLWRRIIDAEWDVRSVFDALAFALAGFGLIAALYVIREPIWAVELCKLFTLLLSLWAGYRFGLNGPAMMTLLMTLGGVGVTMMGAGPFARANFYDSFALLHSYLFAEAIAGMLFAAALADLRRTALAEKRARAMADAASANRIRLLTMISHDVRNPLGGMMGVLQTLQEAGLPDAEARLVGLGLRAGSTLSTLVTDILDVARADAGMITLQESAFDPAASLGDILAMMRDRGNEKGLEIVARGFATLPPRVLGDRVRFEQLFGNLVANAIAYTPHGRVRLSADWQPEQSVMVIEVDDTGPGIEPELVPTMFDAFVLAPRTGSRSAGLGIGLHICKKLTELMGGHIAYRPASGGGSVFRVELCLPATAPPVTISRALPDPPQRVLLVEDDPIAQEVTSAMLEARGHSVSLAMDAEAAVAMVAASQFDLVLMDLQLGTGERYDTELSGLAAARRIRGSDPSANRAKLVALTADAIAARPGAGIESDFDAILIKPLMLNDGLAAAIAAAEQPWQAAAPLQAATSPQRVDR